MADVFDFYVKDNRTIQFNLTEPIMLEDSHVSDWVFHIPSILNNLDVSGWAWWLVYINARGQKYSELLTLSEDPESPLEKCIATYSVDYGMSIRAGVVRFSLEAINTDAGGEILNEWHTQTYQAKVQDTLQGNQVEFAETESDIISALIVEVQNKVAQLVGGATPEPVSLIADMTDTKKVYLYVGSETGESTNYWYYYNGSAWVAGGLYAGGIQVDATPTANSTNAVQSGGVKSALDTLQAQIPQIDPTLTQSGQAADAKVVGDEIGELKEDLSDINNEVFEIDNISIPITYTRKYISSAGTWNTSPISSASDYFAVTPNQRVVLSGVLLTDQNCIAAFYANKKFASKIAGGTNDTTVSFVVPEDCYYIAVTAPLDATAVEGKTFLSSNIKENADKIQKLEAVSFNKTIQFFLTDILRELAWTITNGDGLIESFEQIMGRKSIVVGEPYDYALVSDEYVTKTGIIEGYASWSRTNTIPCDSVDFLVFTGNGTVFTTAGYSVFYDKDMNFISNFTVTLTNDITSVTIPVPQNANTFIISGHMRQFANLVSIVPTRGE